MLFHNIYRNYLLQCNHNIDLQNYNNLSCLVQNYLNNNLKQNTKDNIKKNSKKKSKIDIKIESIEKKCLE